MKVAAVLTIWPSSFVAAASLGQTTTWTAATNPHIVKGTYTVPVGQTLVMEPGVVVQIQSNSTLQVLGTLNANGTATSHISITGVDSYSAKVDVKGTANIAFTDFKA